MNYKQRDSYICFHVVTLIQCPLKYLTIEGFVGFVVPQIHIDVDKSLLIVIILKFAISSSILNSD